MCRLLFKTALRKISTTCVPHFEANTRILTPRFGSTKSLRDLWYDSKYGMDSIKVYSWDWATGKIKENKGLVVAKGKNTVEELVFTCAGTLLVNGSYKFYLHSQENDEKGSHKKCISNDYLAPKDALFTVHPDSMNETQEPTRILMSHSYRVEDTFEILIPYTESSSDNYIAMISDTTGILVKANPTGILSSKLYSFGTKSL